MRETVRVARVMGFRGDIVPFVLISRVPLVDTRDTTVAAGWTAWTASQCEGVLSAILISSFVGP